MSIAKSLKNAIIASAATLAFVGAAAAQDIQASVAAANAQLAQDGRNYRIEMAEYVTDLESNQVGQQILFNNRGNRQLAFDFAPGDPRAPWSGPGQDITFSTDAVDLTADLAGTSELGQLRAAMATWDNVTCSTLPLVDLGNTGDVGFVQFLLGAGGSPNIAADVQHAGFLPAAFFNAIAPGGGGFILGVTFTFIFTDNAGNPTDIDNNGTPDAAFREIYYNDGFLWEIDPNDAPGDGRIDLQSVALHEAGHGLSQAHFGRGFITGNGKIHLAPQAVMNAAYIFAQNALTGTDNAGHCSNWANWPNN